MSENWQSVAEVFQAPVNAQVRLHRQRIDSGTSLGIRLKRLFLDQIPILVGKIGVQ